jgi:hypothetical protein
MKKASSFKLEGVSQQDRFPEAFRPGFFLPEERTTDELLIFAVNLAGQFSYYNQGNVPEGTWEDFFLMDPNILTRVIATYDDNQFIRKHDIITKKLAQFFTVDIDPDVSSLKPDFLQLMELITHIIDKHYHLGLYFDNVVASGRFSTVQEFNKVRSRNDDFMWEIDRLSVLFNITRENFSDIAGMHPGFKIHMQEPDSDWKNWLQELQDVFKKDRESQKIGRLLTEIKKIFAELVLRRNLLAVACRDFRLNKEYSDSYEPHTGLFLSFLGLYQDLKRSFNGITQKHLDLYYKKELGILPRPAVADKVFLQFSLNPSVREFTLNKNEPVMAELPGQNKRIIFTTDEDVTLSHTRIAELKTLYKSEIDLLPSDDDLNQVNVKESKLYCADNPVAVPADFLDNQKHTRAWPVLGEEQLRMAQNIRTMQDADLGLLVASPLLFTADGRRTYQVRFHITRESFNIFDEYAKNYENANSKKFEKLVHRQGNETTAIIGKEVIVYEMLNNAFRISITGPAGWVDIKKYRVVLQEKGTADPTEDNIILLEFELGPQEQAFGVYSPTVHGNAYMLNWPMISILLNNYAFFHPYSFLQHIVMNRITINVSVKASSTLQLRNNFGPLSPSNPFQVFGPQPEPGSYMDIRNTNIFNRYTKKFSINLNWFDLPNDIDGFDNYYLAYNARIKNDSFKVSVNPLFKGMDRLDDKDKLMLNLFMVNDRYLYDQSVLTDSSFAEMKFDNDPLLAVESVQGLKNFNEGAIRIELLKPDCGFGHQLYPVVFPAVLMHNAGGLFGGIFRKKLPVPKLPFAPKIHSVTVDYELQYSTLLSGLKNEADQQDTICLWHYFPFGNQQVYPGRITDGINFIPDFSDKVLQKEKSQYTNKTRSYHSNKANLFIGLTDLVPGKELNLLFQLDEHNFFTPEDDHTPVRWYYLVKNEWIPFDKDTFLSDGTSKFINTGIVKLLVPGDIATGNTILNPDCYWLRASSDTFIRTKVKAVLVQSVAATRKPDYGDTNSSAVGLPPGSLNAFTRKIPEIISVIQSFNSFGGRAAETDPEYYTRVSEMLRNKQRLLTAEDISKAILESFPDEVYKVICYNGKAPQYNYRPGPPLQVVLLPLIKKNSSRWIKEPKVRISTIYNVRNFLENILSPVIGDSQLDVRNPDYETAKVVCSVIFRDNKMGNIAGDHIQQLNNDLRQIISPWLFGTGTEINSDGYIYPSEILNFIKKRPYVEYVTAFSMLHFYNTYNIKTDKEEARVIDSSARGISFLKVFLPGAIFISAESHAIQVIQKSEFEKSPEPGIGELVIGDEFLVDKDHQLDEYIVKTGQADDSAENSIDVYFTT